ncbi:type II toxin-antitoxin system antitoxin DNA ADP-ribosyl glycohydrolase DarG [Mycolicibacterium neworleansense]|uniref:RNase III inhibitor n=1 Tax=Mycolicibacterium neworleansense TaxID=146018 RepID=A0A0H5RS15_9MYCO|nr:macro domain-containing protein [Mycolicibacterium neworleansense]MCV7361591.1 macro domain-containing protein [Mycolicibacterium neworleansense]CRZ16945.1 RNase III inhibitor [Mycolicibacterium neworleansense]
MITSEEGNLLQADADALVNTVNTVGVMGKGIALQFKKAYPAMFKEYARACKAGDVQLGHMHIWETGALDGPRFIINFPTKGHWRAPSKLPDVVAGLADLVAVVQKREITSIAIPPLGCGNGGLNWTDVKPLIVNAFADLPGVDVKIYPPHGAPAASEMPNATVRPKMTVGRASLVSLLAQYSRLAVGATPVEMQKLMYFLQEAGEPLNLKFEPGRYGPYADSLRHVLSTVEGHFITGYGDASAPVLEAEAMKTLPGAEEEADRVLADHVQTGERVDRVMQMIDGFESRYGMELLASVHWVTSHDAAAAGDWREAVEQVHRWTPRKKLTFTAEHIETAWNALRERELTPRV